MQNVPYDRYKASISSRMQFMMIASEASYAMFIYARDFQTRDPIEFIIMKSRPIQVTVVPPMLMGKYISVCPLTVRRVNLF